MRNKKKPGKFIYWTPRILSVIFLFFLAMFSLDVFGEGYGFWGTILAFLIHNIPVFMLAIILWFSWKYEIVGGIAFILAGLLYIAMLMRTAIINGFQGYYLAWGIQISGIAFFIGILFLIGWFRKQKNKN